MADEFKRNWLPAHHDDPTMVTHDDLARDYWKIVR
jgi:hypothetical protein